MATHVHTNKHIYYVTAKVVARLMAYSVSMITCYIDDEILTSNALFLILSIQNFIHMRLYSLRVNCLCAFLLNDLSDFVTGLLWSIIHHRRLKKDNISVHDHLYLLPVVSVLQENPWKNHVWKRDRDRTKSNSDRPRRKIGFRELAR